MNDETRRALAEIRARERGTALWWLGNAGWAIKSDRTLLLIDPVIEPDPEDPALSEIGLPLVHPLRLRAQDLGPEDLDLCLVTHAHGDHLAPRTAPTLAHSTHCRFVVPLSYRERMRELGVPEERMISARHGQVIYHGHLHGSVYSGANFFDCGYLIRDGRFTIFHPGDSVLLHEHLEMAPPDVFLVSITEHNLCVRNAALLANLWRPRYVVPMHYDTYAKALFWTVGDPEAVRAELEDEVKPSYRIVGQGEMLVLEL